MISEELFFGFSFVVLCMTVGGIAILRPIAKHLGSYLETLAKQKQVSVGAASEERMKRIEDLLLAMQEELSKVCEDRDFYEKLNGVRREALLPAPVPMVDNPRGRSGGAPNA